MDDRIWILLWALGLALLFHVVLTTFHPYCLNCTNRKKRQSFWQGDQQQPRIVREEEPEEDA